METEHPNSTLEAEALARRFHEAYEQLAPDFGYKTRDASAVPWEDIPRENKLLMIETAKAVIGSGWQRGESAQAKALRQIRSIPQRPWDERDADSAEARSARAFNYALIQAAEIADAALA